MLKSNYVEMLARRSCAFVIDSIIIITVYSGFHRLFNLIAPGNEVRVSAMQFYTQKDFNVFLYTSLSLLTFIILYLFFSYKSRTGQTVGHRLMGVILVDLKTGLKAKRSNYTLIIAAAIWRFLIVLIPGPLFAFLFSGIVNHYLKQVGINDGGVLFSVFLLFWGLVIILPIPIKREPEPITFWQNYGGYKFILKKDIFKK